MTQAKSWSARDDETAEKLHASIQEARRELGLTFAKESTAKRDEDFEALWKQTLPRISALSVDVFDTALCRRCADPADVFLFLKEEVPFNALPLDPSQILELRIRAEKESREALTKKEGSIEVTLTEIYARFTERTGLDPALIPAMVAAEERVELALTLAHPRISQMIKEAEDNKKTVVYASDTYHSRAFLHRLLTQAGYTVKLDAIFASCEHRGGKANGFLLRRVCEQLGLTPMNMAHLGDNKHSDEAGANAVGMISLLHPWELSIRGIGRHREFEPRRTESILRGAGLVVGRESGDRAFWFQLGVETYGPLMAGFIQWLAAQWRRDKIERGYFLLRDGLILHRVYEVLRETDPSLPAAACLPSSRRAFVIPALGCAQTRNIDTLLTSNNPRPAREFLTRLDLDPSAFPEAFRRAGFSSPDEIVDYRGSPAKVLQLIRQPEVLAVLSRRALLERKLLVRYLTQESVLASGRIALVDVGYNATIQRALLSILNEEKIAHDVYGYYMGTWAGVRDALLPNYRYQGYLFEHGEPLYLSEPARFCPELLELVCTNFAGSLRTFAKGAGKIDPVFDPIEITPGQADKIRVVHEGILAYARSLFTHPLRDRLTEVAPDIAMAPLIRLTTRPTPEEARLLGALEHGDGVGSQTRKPLAAFPNDSLAPHDLFETYRHSYWKQGLLALDTPAALLTRELVAPIS